MNVMNSARTLSLLVVGMGLTINGNSQPVLTNGLLAYYPFNGNALDTSGSRNNLQLLAGTFTIDRFGSPQSAIEFSNAVPFSGPLFSTQIQTPGNTFSLCVWFKTSQPGSLIGFGSAQSTYSYLVDRSLDVTSNGGLSFYVFPGQREYITATNIVMDNQWHSAVATLSSGGMRLYLDGALASSNATVTAAADYSGYWHIGMDVGRIDDVGIYNRALSSTEVQQLYAIESLCTPHKATATATLVNGFLVGAVITDPGCGYTSAPTVLIQGGGGSGATATATVSGGQVAAINIAGTGFGYTSQPKIVIGSPPFVPTVSIAVSKVRVTQNVVLGRNYVLESSTDLVNWTATGPLFTAEAETISSEFDVDVTGRYFRLQEMP